MAEQCIIHFSSVSTDEKLYSLRDFQSWVTMFDAAKIRQHTPLLSITENLKGEEIPVIRYHRMCRSLFTMKRLEMFKRKDCDSDGDLEDCNVIRPHREPQTREARVFAPVCIFCNQEKYAKRARSQEKRIQARQTIRTDDKLRRCATLKCDSRILALTSRDLVAAEAHYHASCYKLYTKMKSQKYDICPSSNTDETVDAYTQVESQAMNAVFQYVRNEVIQAKKVILLGALLSQVKNFISLNGQNFKVSTRKSLRRRLEAEFVNAIKFFQETKET